MPSELHEALVYLFRNRPKLAAELLEEVLGVRLPSGLRAQIADPVATDIKPVSHQADLVVTLASENRVELALVVEVQLSKDAQKKRTWPRYLTAVGAQLGCLANVLVVTPDEQVHRWAAEPIEVGLGNNVITPFVLGPADVPRVDRTTALDRPELAVLSALAHGTERDGEWVARIALAAVASLDEDRCAAYTDFVLNAVSAGVRAELEREMREANYFEATGLVHDLIEKGRALGVADGREEGREEGRRRGQAEALLAVLSARGLSLTENERARVLAERDERTLARWLVAAATARRITDVLD